MQKEEWPFLRSMRQVRPSENWRRHLLLFVSVESDCIGNLKRRWDCHRHTESTETGGGTNFVRDAATSALATGRRILQAKCYRNRYVPVNIILRATENTDFNVDAVAKIPNLGLRRAARRSASGAFISKLRCKLRQTGYKKKDPDVKSTSRAPG
jgi:hypothetical protein